MKLFNLFKKAVEEAKPGRFSDFFLHASEKEKQRVFIEAARKANEDQREILRQSRLKTRVN